MRVSATLAALAVALQQTAAYYKGFNVGANNPDGSCKTRDQWQTAFEKLRGLPQDINVVRLYASSDCNTLANAVPAALATGTEILVGVWTEDSAHFGAEKAALESAINTYGNSWILAISVGSEDLYRGDTTADTLAQQIYDVRGMVRAMGVEAEVGHVDTQDVWRNSANDAVITACDFVGVDAYPYWQGTPIEQAYDVFFEAYQGVKDHVQSIGSGAWVWVTETSWPVTGDNYGNAVASVANAQKFWRSVACELFNEGHVFWYAYQDYNDSPSFGIFDSNGNAIYDLYAC
ncbi:Putative glycoside hydrolase family 17, glycoside hydrolase superfamily [Septoria linicola]|uniref:Probable glucan endo-1,3-beta-glucosidase eglC n=1 Tax=Septoria linicola TaxID=215465 RepID=A0A9Q9EJF5_9PEZI|nr:putative glycoside hydrolase family 17, glycoside hydrolase superfamily [Septoria linicola]USW52169.1 Putative glycoside hydrolase family 17, glycoside hydrolase superfamily [Septoria linicola]